MSYFLSEDSTSELSIAISGRHPILLGMVLAEGSIPSSQSEDFIGRAIGEVLLYWALLNPSWLDSEGTVPTVS